MYKQLIVVEKSCPHLWKIYSRSKTLGIQGSSACARALILSFAHINSWGKVTRLVADRNGIFFGTSTLHSKKWSLCSTDIHLKTKVFRCIQTNTLLFFNSMQVYELYIYVFIDVISMFSCWKNRLAIGSFDRWCMVAIWSPFFLLVPWSIRFL